MGNQAAFRHSGPAMYIYGFVRGRSALGGYEDTGHDLKRLSDDGASLIVWKILIKVSGLTPLSLD